jgi:23S rRNA (uracil1939-C5)-methyltransferase
MSNIIELELTGMAHGGSAVGRHEDRAVFVTYGIPGERARVRITQDKGRFLNAELIEVLHPAESRVQPRCPHFGRCGGCHWQHIDYPAQLEFKRQIVHDQMARIGGLTDVLVHPTIPSLSPWEYRSHATFRIAQDGRPGFFAIDDQTIMPIDECHIIHPALQERLPEIRGYLPRTRIRAQVGSDGQPTLFEIKRNQSEPASEAITYTIKHRAFRCSGGSFFQVNLPQAEKLVELVLERLALSGQEPVLDLYSGVGLFTAFIAEQARRVVAVEMFAPAVQDARFNLSNLGNVDQYEGTIEAVLPRLKIAFDAAIVDPPRIGMEVKALEALAECKPKRIIYVSCDPATLARDAKRLAGHGYQLLDVQPVDMFPQTYHVEAVAAFQTEK